MVQSTEESALAAMQRRAIDSQISHLWSDALFAREQARNHAKRRSEVGRKISNIRQEKPAMVDVYISRMEAEIQQIAWDLGSYVRWTIVSGWMAFERAAEDATGDQDLTRNVHRNLPPALKANAKEGFWQTKPWSDVEQVRRRRNRVVHKALVGEELFPAAALAEEAIGFLREGIREIHAVLGTPAPLWVECDEVPRRLGGSSASLMSMRIGADADPRRIKIVWVHGGREITHAILRSNDDPWPSVEEIARGIQIPIDAIRIYRGDELWRDLPIAMRGSRAPAPEDRSD